MSTIRPISRSPLRGVRIAALALALAAMSPGHAWAQSAEQAQEQEQEAASKRKADAELVVQNSNWLDVHLYLVRDGLARSLGFMTGPGKQRFELPSLATTAGADVRILVTPIGGLESYLSPSLVIHGGDVVDLAIENHLALSSVLIYPGG